MTCSKFDLSKSKLANYRWPRAKATVEPCGTTECVHARPNPGSKKPEFPPKGTPHTKKSSLFFCKRCFLTALWNKPCLIPYRAAPRTARLRELEAQRVLLANATSSELSPTFRRASEAKRSEAKRRRWYRVPFLSWFSLIVTRFCCFWLFVGGREVGSFWGVWRIWSYCRSVFFFFFFFCGVSVCRPLRQLGLWVPWMFRSKQNFCCFLYLLLVKCSIIFFKYL